MRRTLRDYLAPGTGSQRSSPATLRAVLAEDREVAHLLQVDPDWSEEELETAIRERQGQLGESCLLLVPRLWTHEAWAAKLESQAGKLQNPDPRL